MKTINFKKLSDAAVLPVRANPGDAGLDLVAVENGEVVSNEGQKTKEIYHFIEYKTGLAVEIPEGYVGLLFPRSSVSKTSLDLANSVGVIDSGYRGEIRLRFRLDAVGVHAINNMDDVAPSVYKKGDKVGQLVIVPMVTPVPVLSEELSDTQRGEGGFGSSGK
jgi:dUTP pyrophosphatase